MKTEQINKLLLHLDSGGFLENEAARCIRDLLEKLSRKGKGGPKPKGEPSAKTLAQRRWRAKKAAA